MKIRSITTALATAAALAFGATAASAAPAGPAAHIHVAGAAPTPAVPAHAVIRVPRILASCGCYTLTDNYDGHFVEDVGNGYGVQMKPCVSGNCPAPGPEAITLNYCAQKYTGFAGWHLYCLYQDTSFPGVCFQAQNVSGYTYEETCSTATNYQYFWHDGNWIVSLGASQGHSYNAYLQAYDVSSSEFIRVLEGGRAASPNQWTFHGF